MCDEPTEPRHLTEHDREVTLAKLRELFGGPPPDDVLALAEQRWDQTTPPRAAEDRRGQPPTP